MSQRDWLTEEKLTRRLPGGSLTVGDIEFTINPVPETDVLVIQNYLRYDTTVSTRQGYIWKWDLEPIVANQLVRAYDTVFTHLDIQDPRIVTAPPILDWWVGKTYDELKDLRPPLKTRDLSAIASTKDWIPGHRRRNDFVDRLLERIPSTDVFGHGRPQQLADKWDGLASYRYSIAIENTSKPDYWTEKITDCFMSFTVPFYFGATNIDDYFPKDSYIWLPLDQPDQALRIIEQTLADDNWEKRLPALVEARTRILERYSLFGQISRRIGTEREKILAAPRVVTKIHGRRTRKGGWVRGAGVLGNLQTYWRRRMARKGRGVNPFYHPD